MVCPAATSLRPSAEFNSSHRASHGLIVHGSMPRPEMLDQFLARGEVSGRDAYRQKIRQHFAKTGMVRSLTKALRPSTLMNLANFVSLSRTMASDSWIQSLSHHTASMIVLGSRRGDDAPIKRMNEYQTVYSNTLSIIVLYCSSLTSIGLIPKSVIALLT